MTWGAFTGMVMLAAGLAVVVFTLDAIERRRMACDGCRLEALGSSMPWLRHTCSRRRALFSDRRGRTYVFGKRCDS